jgi:CHASE2 domain-containing sensor protein
MLSIDEDTLNELGRNPQGYLSRRSYASLFKLLADRPPRLVFLDQALPQPGPDPGEDEALAQALAGNGRVVIGAYTKEAGEVGSAPLELARKPLLLFRTNAAWGYLDLWPSAADQVVRRLVIRPPRTDPEDRAAAWVAARQLGAAATVDEAGIERERWLRYYGSAKGTFGERRPLHEVLRDPTLLPPDLTNRLMFVGGSPAVGQIAQLKDTSPHPDRVPIPRVDLHATAVLNLIRNHGEWLVRLGGGWQLLLVVAWGAAAGRWAALLAPRTAGIVLVWGALTLAVASVLFHCQANVWWSWTIPVLVQTPLAFAIGSWIRLRTLAGERRTPNLPES